MTSSAAAAADVPAVAPVPAAAPDPAAAAAAPAAVPVGVHPDPFAGLAIIAALIRAVRAFQPIVVTSEAMCDAFVDAVTAAYNSDVQALSQLAREAWEIYEPFRDTLAMPAGFYRHFGTILRRLTTQQLLMQQAYDGAMAAQAAHAAHVAQAEQAVQAAQAALRALQAQQAP